MVEIRKRMINTRVKVKGTLKNGITSEFSGNLDNVIETPAGKIAIVGRTPVYNVTSIEPNPSGFERNWNKVL